jgi:hypothetical protein
LESCGGTVVRREEAKTCPSAIPRATGCTAQQQNCNSDGDCTTSANGYCQLYAGGGGAPSSCDCAYGCVNDSDCAADEVCLCGDPVGTCVKADCKTSNDCAPGYDCVTPTGACVASYLACQGPADECLSEADCSSIEYCGVGPQGNLVCKTNGCAGLGRPFLVEGTARTAEVALRDFGSALPAELAGLSDSERLELAEHWTRVGLMEHASIAAFARFALQLLHLGAPLDLLQRTNAAQVDETRHAEVAFALAGSFAGRALGPGPLDLDGALPEVEPRQVLSDVIVEGCIGETLAAVEAEHAAAHARDPLLRQTLATIARDEARHAELAWRFVAWMLERYPELRGFVRSELTAAIQRTRSEPLPPADAGAERRLELGILDGRERAEVRRDALDRAVARCADALLGPDAVPASVAVA